jgi:hypothetical protein
MACERVADRFKQSIVMFSLLAFHFQAHLLIEASRKFAHQPRESSATLDTLISIAHNQPRVERALFQIPDTLRLTLFEEAPILQSFQSANMVSGVPCSTNQLNSFNLLPHGRGWKVEALRWSQIAGT